MTTREGTKTEAVQQPPTFLSTLGFVKMGGVSTIVAMVLLLGGIITHIMYGASPPDGMDVYLTEINANPGGNLLSTSLELSALILLLVFMIAMYQLFRDDGGIMRLAVIAGSVGLSLMMLSKFFSIAGVELAAHYVAADSATKPAIAAMTETMLGSKAVISLVGNLLAWGVGGLLFSLAIVRTTVLSRWLGYGGVIYASTMWVTTVEVAAMPGVTSRDSIVFFFGTWLGLLWLLAMGIGLVRLDDVPRG